MSSTRRLTVRVNGSTVETTSKTGEIPRPTFLSPEDTTEITGENLSIYWIRANPGTGKTVLASHVISQLQELQLECAYHYFHVGDEVSRSLGSLLRSISHQMAISNSAIRDKLFQLQQEGSTFDMDDSWTIWAKIFRKGVLQVRCFQR